MWQVWGVFNRSAMSGHSLRRLSWIVHTDFMVHAWCKLWNCEIFHTKFLCMDKLTLWHIPVHHGNEGINALVSRETFYRGKLLKFGEKTKKDNLDFQRQTIYPKKNKKRYVLLDRSYFLAWLRHSYHMTSWSHAASAPHSRMSPLTSTHYSPPRYIVTHHPGRKCESESVMRISEGAKHPDKLVPTEVFQGETCDLHEQTDYISLSFYVTLL